MAIYYYISPFLRPEFKTTDQSIFKKHKTVTTQKQEWKEQQTFLEKFDHHKGTE